MCFSSLLCTDNLVSLLENTRYKTRIVIMLFIIINNNNNNFTLKYTDFGTLVLTTADVH